jgi:hypothetical protein
MNAICSPGNPGAGVDSAFPEQLVIISKVSTAISDRHFRFVIDRLGAPFGSAAQIGMR